MKLAVIRSASVIFINNVIVLLKYFQQPLTELRLKDPPTPTPDPPPAGSCRDRLSCSFSIRLSFLSHSAPGPQLCLGSKNISSFIMTQGFALALSSAPDSFPLGFSMAGALLLSPPQWPLSKQAFSDDPTYLSPLVFPNPASGLLPLRYLTSCLYSIHSFF